MKTSWKKTAAVLMAGTLAAGMLAGCGKKALALDGTKTVATVNGTEIPMGLLSLDARYQQMQQELMYYYYGMSGTAIWDTVADSETGTTYGMRFRDQILDNLETWYIEAEHAEEYGIEFSDEDKKAISDAADAFIESNSEETLKEISVTKENVEKYLELYRINHLMQEKLADEAPVEITDEEAVQTSFTYVSISYGGEDATDEDKENAKANAEKVLEKLNEEPEIERTDLSDFVKTLDESYNATRGHFTKDEDAFQAQIDEGLTSSYADEVMEALRTLSDGEVYPEVIDTGSAAYVVRLDKLEDEEYTESMRSTLTNHIQSEYVTEKIQEWKDAADIKVDDKVLKTLEIIDTHKYVAPTPTPAPTEEPKEEEAAEEETTEEAAEEPAEETEEKAEEKAEDKTEDKAAEETEEKAEDEAAEKTETTEEKKN